MTFEDMYCREVVQLLTDYLDDVLPRADRERLERHIASCPGCEGYLAQFREAIALVGALRLEDIPAAAMEELVGVYRAWRG